MKCDYFEKISGLNQHLFMLSMTDMIKNMITNKKVWVV